MKKPTDTTLAISADYRQFIKELKARVISARISAARAITHEAVLLYWDIGRGIVEKQKEHGRGDSVVESSPRICSGIPWGERLLTAKYLANAADLSSSYSRGISVSRDSALIWPGVPVWPSHPRPHWKVARREVRDR